MKRLFAALLLLFACGAPGPVDLPQNEPNEEPTAEASDSPREPLGSSPGSGAHHASPCTEASARLAAHTTSPHRLFVGSLRFESGGSALAAVLDGEEFASPAEVGLSLHLTMALCTGDGWRLWRSVPIGSVRKIAGDDPRRYERANIELGAVELSGGSYAAQIAWRHSQGPPAERRVDRRSVRWFALGDAGPVSLGECTTRDLRSIDSSSFVQGHEVRRWRVVPGTPPRLVGDRVAGGGQRNGPAMTWSDETDHRTLNVPLVEVEPDLSELCL